MFGAQHTEEEDTLQKESSAKITGIENKAIQENKKGSEGKNKAESCRENKTVSCRVSLAKPLCQDSL